MAGIVIGCPIAWAPMGKAIVRRERSNQVLLPAMEEDLEGAVRWRTAMSIGGEMQTWRGALRAEALTGAGRPAEAAELAALGATAG